MRLQRTKLRPFLSAHRTLLGGELASSRPIHVAGPYPNVLKSHQSGEIQQGPRAGRLEKKWSHIDGCLILFDLTQVADLRSSGAINRSFFFLIRVSDIHHDPASPDNFHEQRMHGICMHQQSAFLI